MKRLTKKNEDGIYTPRKDNMYVSQFVDKVGKYEDLEEKLGMDIDLYINTNFQGYVYVKGMEPEWIFSGTKDDIVRYCVVTFNSEVLAVKFSRDYEVHFIQNPVKKYGKIWALTKEELED